MSHKVEIRGDDGLVWIEVRSYERLKTRDVDDSNWLSCSCGVQVRGFVGRMNLSLTTHDLERFDVELRRSLKKPSGTATFSTMEDRIKIEVEFKVTGAAQIRGVVGERGNLLSFSFESDQTFLTEAERQLRSIVQEFSVRK